MDLQITIFVLPLGIIQSVNSKQKMELRKLQADLNATHSQFMDSAERDYKKHISEILERSTAIGCDIYKKIFARKYFFEYHFQTFLFIIHDFTSTFPAHNAVLSPEDEESINTVLLVGKILLQTACKDLEQREAHSTGMSDIFGGVFHFHNSEPCKSSINFHNSHINIQTNYYG